MNNIDFDYHWMPFTANKDFKKSPRIVTKAEGMYYWDDAGNKILDGASGLFTCAAGHGRKEISDAVQHQIKTLDYAPHFNTASPGSFEFSKMLSRLTPEGMNKIFFCCSGSEAVDSSMKIVRAYWNIKQPSKTMFVSRDRAYHGVNWGGTSLSGMVNNRRSFGQSIPGVVHLKHTWMEEHRFQTGQPQEGGADLANDLQRLVELYGAENIGACYIEPIAGSYGTLVPPVGYLERIRELCTEHNILLVFDEVITGFGRTGKAFASQTFKVKPDMFTLAKALTNGNIPMGAVVVNDDIYHVIVDSNPELAVELFHGYTYSAHPVACAAGIATMKIYQDENLFERGEALAPYFQKKLFELKKYDIVTDIRGFGMIGAVDIKPEPGKLGLRGRDFYQSLFRAGLHLKSTGESMIIAPPLISKQLHIDEMFTKINHQISKY